MQSSEAIAVYPEDDTKHINIIYAQNAEFY
jgi:hypothetical protein